MQQQYEYSRRERGKSTRIAQDIWAWRGGESVIGVDDTKEQTCES